jgi:hypothetical protein
MESLRVISIMHESDVDGDDVAFTEKKMYKEALLAKS